MKTGYSLKKKILAHLMLLAILTVSLAAIRPQKAYAYEEKLYKYTVKVEKNYLALRKGKAFKAENEIGKLYTGDTVIHCPTDSENETYWYVYSPKLNKLGYVNRNYLRFDEEYSGKVHYTAKVKKGYLALRKAKAYDAKNEKGKMYTGDEVIVLHKDNKSDYWTVYSPDLELAGYTNKNYLKYDPYYEYNEAEEDDDDDYEDDDDEDYEPEDKVYDDVDYVPEKGSYKDDDYEPEDGVYDDVDYDADARDGFDLEKKIPALDRSVYRDDEYYTTMIQSDNLIFSRAQE